LARPSTKNACRMRSAFAPSRANGTQRSGCELIIRSPKLTGGGN
jgi:hypothetical protein